MTAARPRRAVLGATALVFTGAGSCDADPGVPPAGEQGDGFGNGGEGLADAGWWRVHDPAAPARADALFATDAVPWCGTYF